MRLPDKGVKTELHMARGSVTHVSKKWDFGSANLGAPQPCLLDNRVSSFGGLIAF